MNQKGWEYRIEEFHSERVLTMEERLGTLGGEGWEAVTSWTTPESHLSEGVRVCILLKKRK